MAARRRRLALVALTIAAAVATSALGTVDVAGAAKPKLPSKHAFIKRADRVCQQGNRFASASLRKLPSSANDVDALLVLLPIIQQRFDSIRALAVPKGDAKRIKRIIDTGERELRSLAKHPGKLRKGKALTRSTRLARAYGLKACGKAVKG